jgi:hypothetical protein
MTTDTKEGRHMDSRTRFGNLIDHWHAVSTDVGSREAEHQAWHETGEPCALCGRFSWTTCPVYRDGSRGGPYCYAVVRTEPDDTTWGSAPERS